MPKREGTIPYLSAYIISTSISLRLCISPIKLLSGILVLLLLFVSYSTLLFLGLTGLSTLLMYWPLFFILHYSGMEIFEWPTPTQWNVILISSILDVFFNMLLLLAILLMSPLFVSVGSLLTIPLSIVAGKESISSAIIYLFNFQCFFFSSLLLLSIDRFFHHYLLPPLAFVGGGLIVIGFLIMNISEYLAEKKHHHQQSHTKERTMGEAAATANQSPSTPLSRWLIEHLY